MAKVKVEKKGDKKAKKRSHVQPELPLIPAGQKGWWRLKHVIAYFGISASTYYDGVKTGTYPKPDVYRGRVPFWRSENFG